MVNLNNLCKNPDDIKELVLQMESYTMDFYIAIDENCSHYWYKKDTNEARKYKNECAGRDCFECRETAYKELRQAFILSTKKNNIGVW